MKRNLLFIISILSFGLVNAQTTETFESFPLTATSFTSGSVPFTLTPTGFTVSTIVGYGYASSDKYIDNSNNNANPCQLKATSGGYTIKSLYLYPSTFANGQENTTSGVDVLFTGKLGGVTQFTYNPPAANFAAASYSNATNRGFSLVNFATPGFDNSTIDELVIDLRGTLVYFAIDNLTFSVSAVCNTPTLSLTGSTNVLCNGNSTGSATVSATGGSPFTYTWSPSGGNSSIATGLSVGVYTCITTNSCGLTASQTVSITQPSSLTTSVAGTNAVCNGFTGSATITATGGTGTYTYLWSSGATTSVITVAPGSYSGTVTDVNGCTSSKSISVTQPSAIVTTTAATNVLCNGGMGSATITATGGTGAYTYLWSTGATTSVITAFAGVYSVFVGDVNNCISVRSVGITEASAVVTTTAATNVLCNGGAGSATITATGGTGAYTYLWSTGATTSVIVGFAGVYTGTVTDANNCISVKSVAITQPSALTTSTAITNVLCNGGNGSATITAIGGAGAYTYLWSTGATTSVITAPAGVYTATVTDANGCASSKSTSITQPSAVVTTTTTVMNALCSGSNGSGTITATGGTGAYTYLWSTGVTTSVITGFAGVYTGTVTDANGCTSSKTISITQPSAIATTTAATNVLCNGGTGSGTITATGGTGAYTYLWSTGATTSVVTGFAGVYTATVTDANNCSTSKSVGITEPTAIVTTTAVTNVLCNGGTGSGTITATGGTGAYTYLWSTGATTSVITGFAGVYTGTVTDANGCTSSKTISITQPSAIATTTAATNALCNGGTGSATITATGGTGAYTYLWSTAATTSVITGAAGVYTGTVTDANNCSSVKSVMITEPTAIVTTTAVTNVLCNGGTGSGTITATGGTGAYTYLWSTAATTSVIVGFAGVYTVTVTDANNCSSVKSIEITAPVALTLTAVAGSASVCPGSTTTLTANGSGGTGIITYSWVSGPSNSVFIVTPSVSGIYTVSISDANNCLKSQTVSITVNVTPTITVNSGIICSNNSFTMMPTGAGTYTFSSGSSIVSPTTTTTYSVTGTSLEGCLSSNTAISTVTVNTTPTITVNSGVICSNTSFTMVPTGADTYTFSNGNAIVSPTTTTSYTVSGTSLEGCLSYNETVSTVTVNITPTITVNSGVICSNNSFTMVPMGADTYTFSNGSAIVSPTTTITYSVTGTSLEGCLSSNTAISTVTVNTTPTITVNSGVICSNNSFTMTPSGADTYTYSSGSAIVSPTTITSYTVSGTSLEGCLSYNETVSTVTVNTTPTISVNSGIICSNTSFTMVPMGADTYTFSNGSAIVSPTTTTSYTVTGTSLEGCLSYNESVSTVTVNTTPTISVNGGAICINTSFTMAPMGADSYTFSNGNAIVSPTTTTSYTVTGTSLEGCLSYNEAVSTVSVNALPTVSITAKGNWASFVCFGQQDTLIATGADSYVWDNSSTNDTLLIVENTITSWSVTGTDVNGCVNMADWSIVGVYPSYSITVNSGVICSGQSFTMVPNGAITYSYSNGSDLVSPSTSESYTVTGIDAQGCLSSNTAISTVTVNITPTITVNSGVICSNNSFTMVPTGADTYTYSSGSSVVSPTITESYTITGTSIEGCENTATSSVTVNTTPTITVNSGAICSGNSFTMVPTGADTYTFTSGVAVVSPSVTESYTVTGTSLEGCISDNIAISSVTVNANPTLTITVSSLSICPGNTATLTVSGATSYTWNNGSNAAAISVNPVTTIDYTVTGTNADGCIDTKIQTINLYPNPVITLVSSSASVCAGFSSTLTAAGVNTYTWSTGSNSTSIIATPTTSTGYTVTGTDLNGCETNTMTTVAFNVLPVVTAVASSTGVCAGTSTTLMAGGATTYVWNTGDVNATISVSPISGVTDYTVIGTTGAGCTAQATVNVTVYSSPTVSIGSDVEVGLGGDLQFNPTQSGAVSYSWTPSDFLNLTNVINPLTTPEADITYILVAMSANGCTASDTVNVKLLTELIIANYMSPNNDGMNDTWKVNVPALVKKYSVEIIDSYNQKVFSKSNNYNNEFDGKYNGDDLPDGVYYYFIKDGSTVKYKGSITLTK